jgi:hypothetical protein
MTTDEVICAFGGREAVMAITGAARNAVNNWRHDGIPYRHFLALSLAAQARGIQGIDMAALWASRPKEAA